MRLLVLALIGLLLLNIALKGNIGSILGSIIAPQAMVET
jgi:hypothetical protein